jgi:AP-4 complex subunit epsilon-1
MMQARTLVDKRVGYLACSLVLHADHPFVLLIIGSIQRDLKSEVYLEGCMGLQLACKVMNSETSPALFPMVVGMLDHKQALVRKKAVMALQRFHMIDPSTCNGIVDKIRRVLSDRDPSVMGASLNLLHDMIRSNAAPFKDLVASFVNILQQVLAHRLPHDYEYHRTPAPWIQIRLLQILALLGANDKQCSEGMYDCLQEVLKSADTATNVVC